MDLSSIFHGSRRFLRRDATHRASGRAGGNRAKSAFQNECQYALTPVVVLALDAMQGR